MAGTLVVSVFMISVVGYYTNGATTLKVNFSVVAQASFFGRLLFYFSTVPIFCGNHRRLFLKSCCPQ